MNDYSLYVPRGVDVAKAWNLEFQARLIAGLSSHSNKSSCTLLCVYQQNPILATGDSSVISNYR